MALKLDLSDCPQENGMAKGQTYIHIHLLIYHRLEQALEGLRFLK